jgi:hypothetical protein
MARYWLSFDLGLSGDYDELYAWLDNHGAKECGDSVATFVTDAPRTAIIKDMQELLDLNRNPRIYLIDMTAGGKFVLGKRKVAPWTGYGQVSIDGDEEA